MPTRRTTNPGRRAKPPASGNLPAHGRRILAAAYESAKARALEQGKSAKAAKRTASAQAWCAVKRSYYKRGSKWVKRKATLGTGEQPPGCTPLRRRKNPAGWTRGKTSTDRHGNEQIEYTRGDRKAKLTLHDESVTATVEGHHLEEAPDQSKFYRSEQAALADASRVADLFDDRRVKRFPTRGEDWEPYLEWFKMQSPNQADYVTLFWTNDPNGAYDSLLLEPISESEATFDETFVDEGYRKGEHDENPEPDEEDDELSYEELRQRYRGDVEYENPSRGPDLAWNEIVVSQDKNDPPILQTSPVETIARGTGVIRIRVVRRPPRKHGQDWKPVKIGKKYGYEVGFHEIDPSKPERAPGYWTWTGEGATIVSPHNPLVLEEAKRAAALWLEGKNFTVDDGKISSVLNPYLGDAVELSQRRKYEEERSRWEKGGRRGPPPAPPRSRQRNPRQASLSRRITGV